MPHYIGPWRGSIGPDGVQEWDRPAGTIRGRCFDYRAVDLNQPGLGYFETTIDPGPEYAVIGTGTLDDRPTISQRSALLSTLGITRSAPSGLSLWQLLFWTALHNGDPDGSARVGPLMPGRNGKFRAWGREIGFKGLTDTAWPVIQARIQRDYRTILEQHAGRGDGKLHRRWLWLTHRKLGVPWEDCVPGDLSREEPQRPSTTYSEPFDDLADWENVIGTFGNWAAVAGVLEFDGPNAVHYIRHTLDLSGSDNRAEIELRDDGATTGSTIQVGVQTRTNSAASDADGYMTMRALKDSLDNSTLLRRTDTSSRTTLDSITGPASFTAGEVISVQADGSSITGEITGSSADGVLSATDATYSSGVQASLYAFMNTGVSAPIQADNLVSEDLALGRTLTRPLTRGLTRGLTS